MKRIILAALLAAPFALSAAGPDTSFKDCTTKGEKMRLTKKAELQKMAKVSEADAKKAALGTAGSGATIVKGGLEVESNCLVYSYHVKDPAHKGQTEVFVDAGSGAILKTEKESALRAAAEKPVDKVKEVAGKTKEKVTGEPSTNQAVKK
ncbi:MAG TPA: PepSY domain-containing protein [Usitatibacter sp.]|nr:PepSY domain-containing protein [Usitatibacter sp.]